MHIEPAEGLARNVAEPVVEMLFPKGSRGRIPIIGIMGAEELEDYLELRDPKVREHIRKSHADYLAGKRRPLGQFLAEVTPLKKKRRPA